jgi:S1-C subfamily serine protease
VNLYRQQKEDVRKVDVPVVTLENRVPDRDRLGHVGSKKIGINSREADDLEYPDQLTSAIVSALRPTWANAGVVRLATQKGDEAVRSTKYYLKPVLLSLDMDLEEMDDRLYGEVRSRINWTFVSGVVKDSVLFTIERDNNYPVFHETASEVLANAMGDAAHRLVDEEGLAERLGAVFTKGLTLSKGTEIQLRTPKPIPFTGRKDMLAALVKGVVTIETSDGHGSGFLLTHDGHLLTNAHVVGDDAKVKVRFQQGFTLEGEVVKVNRDFDVALVKTPGEDLPALTLGVDSALQLGEELFAIGTPLDKELGQTVTRGIMSGMRTFEGRTFLQTDVPINPGNSGGPLIDETGKVVGVATLKISDGGVQGIGFGVPISKAIQMLNISFTP